MKLSVCVDAIFMGKELSSSLNSISDAVIKTFEFWSWWDKDIPALKEMKDELGLSVLTFCTKMISLVDASKRADYLKALEESVAVAKTLDCRSLITQVGNDTGYCRARQHKNLVEGLKACAPLLEENDVTLLVEPLNVHVDHPGYYLSGSLEGFDIIDEVGSPNVKLLFDIYHQQITEGNLIRNITGNIDKIGHFHAAGNPGRHELFYGELNYDRIFDTIDKTDYKGYAGLEYFPTDDPVKGLKHLHKIHTTV
jgi:hydroxypyruvate isomerase